MYLWAFWLQFSFWIIIFFWHFTSTLYVHMPCLHNYHSTWFLKQLV
jgi:hypothetical protein